MSTLSELTYAQFKPDAGTIRMLPDHDTNATMFWVSRIVPEEAVEAACEIKSEQRVDLDSVNINQLEFRSRLPEAEPNWPYVE